MKIRIPILIEYFLLLSSLSFTKEATIISNNENAEVNVANKNNAKKHSKNNSPNKIVLNLYPGILDVAKLTNAWIVPIATLKGGDGVYSSIGPAIDSERLDGEDGIQRLRDELATLKWKLMEYESKNNPVTIPHGDAGIAYWKQTINAEIKTVKFYDRIAEQQCIYRE